jgi:hypothetical protein
LKYAGLVGNRHQNGIAASTWVVPATRNLISISPVGDVPVDVTQNRPSGGLAGSVSGKTMPSRGGLLV